MKRILLIILAVLAVLILVPLVGILIFLNNPEWQRSVVLGQLDAQPGMEAEARYVKAGLGGAEIDDLFLLSYDTGIFVDEATVKFNPWALLSQTVEVSLVDAKGVKIAPGIESRTRLKQLFPEVEGDYQPTPAPVATTEPEEPGEPLDFDGILAMTRDLGFKLELEQLTADGLIVLPDNSQLTFEASGGDIAPGREGTLKLDAQLQLAQPINGYDQATQSLKLQLEQLAEGGFSRIRLEETLRLTGDAVEPVALLADGALRAEEEGETYRFNLRSDSSPQPLIDFQARWQYETESLEGSLAMDIDSEETDVLAALLQPHQLVWQGQADFSFAPESSTGSLEADFDGRALVAADSALPLQEDLELDLNFVAQADYQPTGLRAPQLKLTVVQEGGERLLSVQNLQPIELDQDFQNATEGELLEVALQLPRTLWDRLQLDAPLKPQAVVANLRLAQTADGLTLSAPQPVQAVAQLQTDGRQPRNLTLRFSPRARMGPTAGQAGWDDLRITFDNTDLLNGQAEMSCQMPEDGPMQAKVSVAYQGSLPPEVARALLGEDASRLPSEIRSQGEIAADYSPEALTLQTLDLNLAAEGSDLLTVRAPKALRLDPQAADFGLSQLQGQLLTLQLNDVPLQLANAFLGGASVTGTAGGSLAVSAADEKVRVEAAPPLQLTGFSYRDPQEGPMLSDLSGKLDLLAVVSAEDFAFELRQLQLTSPAGEIVSGSLKAQGPLSADVDTEMQVEGRFDLSFANLMQQPLAADAPQPIRSTTGTLEFSGQAQPAKHTGSFSGSFQAGTIVGDELLALIPQGGAAQPVEQEQPQAGQSGPSPEVPSSEPDEQPLWEGYTGELSLRIDQLIQGEATVADAQGELRLEPSQVVLDFGAKQEQTPIKLNARLAFDEQQPQSPYQLSGSVDVQDFNPGPFLTAAQGQSQPPLEGTFNVAGDIAGSAPNLAVIADRVTGNFKITSQDGVVRPLGKYDRTLSLTSRGLGLLSGLAGGDTAKYAQKAQSVLDDVLKGLSEVKYDNLTFDIARDESLDLLFKTINIEAPNVHFVGQGEIDYIDGEPVTDWISDIKLSLRGSGPLVENLRSLGFEFPDQDSKGYTAIESFELTGPLGDLQSTLQQKIFDHAKRELLDEGGNYLRRQFSSEDESQADTAEEGEGTAEETQGDEDEPEASTGERILGGLLQGLQNRREQRQADQQEQSQQSDNQ